MGQGIIGDAITTGFVFFFFLLKFHLLILEIKSKCKQGEGQRKSETILNGLPSEHMSSISGPSGNQELDVLIN